jgi:hypothetical protein
MHQSEVKEEQRACPLRGTRASMRTLTLLRAQATALNFMFPCRVDADMRVANGALK